MRFSETVFVAFIVSGGLVAAQYGDESIYARDAMPYSAYEKLSSREAYPEYDDDEQLARREAYPDQDEFEALARREALPDELEERDFDEGYLMGRGLGAGSQAQSPPDSGSLGPNPPGSPNPSDIGSSNSIDASRASSTGPDAGANNLAAGPATQADKLAQFVQNPFLTYGRNHPPFVPPAGRFKGVKRYRYPKRCRSRKIYAINGVCVAWPGKSTTSRERAKQRARIQRRAIIRILQRNGLMVQHHHPIPQAGASGISRDPQPGAEGQPGAAGLGGAAGDNIGNSAPPHGGPAAGAGGMGAGASLNPRDAEMETLYARDFDMYEW